MLIYLPLLGCCILLAAAQVLDPDFDCPEPTGWFASPTSCADYYGCSGDIAWKYTCAEGTLWDVNNVS